MSIYWCGRYSNEYLFELTLVLCNKPYVSTF